MTDKSQPLILEALSRAAAQPAGLPLHGGKAKPGLFAASPAARKLARRCVDEGLLRVVGAETRGKAVQEICALSEQGLAYLLAQGNPRQVLEDLVRGLESRQSQLAELVATAKQVQDNLNAMKQITEKVLAEIRRPASPAPKPASNGTGESSESWSAAVLAHLRSWRNSSALEDCPLPDLYRVAKLSYPPLSIGQFHDGLRRLHAQHQVYLHPWTGPLYELPEPALALLIGHVVAYYASLR